MPRPSAQRVSRRSALAAAGAAALSGLAGCTSSPSRRTSPGPTSEPRPGADETARRKAAALELSLADLAGRAAAGPDRAIAAAFAAAATAHAAHSAALLEGLPPSASAVATKTTPPASTTAPATSPTDQARGLVAAQGDAATSHQDAVTAVSGPLARLLASVAASDLAHAAALRRLAKA